MRMQNYHIHARKYAHMNARTHTDAHTHPHSCDTVFISFLVTLAQWNSQQSILTNPHLKWSWRLCPLSRRRSNARCGTKCQCWDCPEGAVGLGPRWCIRNNPSTVSSWLAICNKDRNHLPWFYLTIFMSVHEKSVMFSTNSSANYNEYNISLT